MLSTHNGNTHLLFFTQYQTGVLKLSPANHQRIPQHRPPVDCRQLRLSFHACTACFINYQQRVKFDS